MRNTKKTTGSCCCKRLKPRSAFLRAEAQSSLGQSAPTWLPGALPVRAGWAVYSLPISQMASRRRWRHKECSHTSFVLPRHTKGHPFQQAWFPTGTRFLFLFIYFFLNANKMHVVNRTKQTSPGGPPLCTSSVDFRCRGFLLPGFHPGKDGPLEAQAGRVPDSFLQHSAKCPDVLLLCICINSISGCQNTT